MWMFLTRVIERGSRKSLCGSNRESRQDPFTSVLQHSSAPKPGKCRWHNTKLEQVSPAFLPRMLSPRQQHQECNWCRYPACRICCRCSLRGERRIFKCPGWPAQKAGAMNFWYHTHNTLTPIRWNCSGSQCRCQHQLQDKHSTPESLWTGKDWAWQCPADSNSGSPFWCCMVGWSWDEHWTVSHLLADPP